MVLAPWGFSSLEKILYLPQHTAHSTQQASDPATNIVERRMFHLIFSALFVLAFLAFLIEAAHTALVRWTSPKLGAEASVPRQDRKSTLVDALSQTSENLCDGSDEAKSINKRREEERPTYAASDVARTRNISFLEQKKQATQQKERKNEREPKHTIQKESSIGEQLEHSTKQVLETLSARETQQEAYLQSSEQAEEKQRQKRKKIIERSIKKNEERMKSKASTTPSPAIHTSALFDRTSSLHSIVSRRLQEDRKLKEDQDKEYQKALEIDMLKQQEKEREQERQRLLNEANERKRQHRLEIFRSLPEEPPSTCTDTVCRFRFRLPGGQHVERRFLSSDTLQVVLDFVCGVVAQTAASEEEAAAELELVSDFPRRTYADTSMTLREAGLCPVAKLIVQHSGGASTSPSPSPS